MLFRLYLPNRRLGLDCVIIHDLEEREKGWWDISHGKWSTTVPHYPCLLYQKFFSPSHDLTGFWVRKYMILWIWIFLMPRFVRCFTRIHPPTLPLSTPCWIQVVNHLIFNIVGAIYNACRKFKHVGSKIFKSFDGSINIVLDGFDFVMRMLLNYWYVLRSSEWMGGTGARNWKWVTKRLMGCGLNAYQEGPRLYRQRKRATLKSLAALVNMVAKD